MERCEMDIAECQAAPPWRYSFIRSVARLLGWGGI
jgi:hypothetical protein